MKPVRSRASLRRKAATSSSTSTRSPSRARAASTRSKVRSRRAELTCSRTSPPVLGRAPAAGFELAERPQPRRPPSGRERVPELRPDARRGRELRRARARIELGHERGDRRSTADPPRGRRARDRARAAPGSARRGRAPERCRSAALDDASWRWFLCRSPPPCNSRTEDTPWARASISPAKSSSSPAAAAGSASRWPAPSPSTAPTS